MDVYRRVVQLGVKHRGFNNHRQMSQLVQSNGRPPSLVDTTALVRRLEAQGMPTKQAEAITGAISEVSSNSLENAAYFILSKTDQQKKIDMLQEFKLDSMFKNQIQSFQVHHFSMLQSENEKLRHDIEKFCSELRYQMDKVIAGQRLDVNLERGRIREELASQIAETAKLRNKLDRDIHALRAKLEGAKYDVIKYCIITLTSISAAGLAVIQFWM